LVFFHSLQRAPFQASIPHPSELHLNPSNIAFPTLLPLLFTTYNLPITSPSNYVFTLTAMFLSTSSIFNAALAVLLCFEDAMAAPMNSTGLAYSPINIASPGTMSSTIHSSTNRTVAPIDLAYHNETVADGLTKRGTTGDLEAHWQFVLEETVCGDFGQVCFSPQANLWVDYYANGASSSSQQLHIVY
jgi:hypothetical protein